MPYEAACPKGHRLQVTEAHFGERVKCPTCGESFVVPEAGNRIPASGTPPPADLNAGDRPRRWKAPLGAAAGLSQVSLLAGRPMVVLGLLLVILARGCDTIGRRAIDRAKAKLSAARESFDEDCRKDSVDLENKISALEENKDLKSPEYQKMLADLRIQQRDLTERQAKQRKAAESGSWRILEANARAAETSCEIDAYWREIFFVFASIVLATGLLIVSWSADGAQRWASLIMLAIITASIYLGGAAWLPLGH